MAVTLKVGANEPQRRWTVAIRIILAIPQALFLALLSVVAFVVIFFVWLAALFTARVPPGMGDFLRKVLQYQARVLAYGQLLLTDRYPPWDVGAAEYPVELEIDEPDRFNRAAVFFRFFLQLPALVLSQLVYSGLTVILFVAWLITLVRGRLPDSAHVAFATILRYQQRVYAYVGMLTTEYPGGLFGDRAADVGTPAPSSPSLTADAEPAGSPKTTRFVLSGGAKVIVVLALVLGVVSSALNLANAEWGLFGSAAELADLDRDLEAEFDEWSERSEDCSRAELADCQRGANAALRFELEEYRRALLDIEVPERAFEEATALLASLEEMHLLLGRMNEADADEQLRLYFLVLDAKDVYDDRVDELLTEMTFS